MWLKIILFLFGNLYKQQAAAEEGLNNDMADIIKWLQSDNVKALNHIQSLGQEAITTRNAALSQRRNLYLTIFATAGTFLTVALPLLDSIGSPLADSRIFKIITLILLASLVIGVIASLLEWSYEVEGADFIRRNSEKAFLFLLKGRINECAEILIATTNKQKLFLNFWQLVWIVVCRNVAFYLFIIGVISLTILFIFQPAWLIQI